VNVPRVHQAEQCRDDRIPLLDTASRFQLARVFVGEWSRPRLGSAAGASRTPDREAKGVPHVQHSPARRQCALSERREL